MNAIKKFSGILWMLIAPAIVIALTWEAWLRISVAEEAAKANSILQWSIILLIFIPICTGFFIFGLYAIKGEYEE